MLKLKSNTNDLCYVLGGGFGGKERGSAIVAVATALAAYK